MSLSTIHRTAPVLGTPITAWTDYVLERLQNDVEYYTEILYERCSIQSCRHNADEVDAVCRKLELAASIIRQRTSGLREVVHEHA